MIDYVNNESTTFPVITRNFQNRRYTANNDLGTPGGQLNIVIKKNFNPLANHEFQNSCTKALCLRARLFMEHEFLEIGNYKIASLRRKENVLRLFFISSH